MKAPILTLLGLALSLPVMAETINYECGSEFGLPVTLQIKKSPAGSFYEFEGTFKASGTDSTTGTLLRSKTTKLEGSRESSPEGKYFHMNDVEDGYHQVLAQISKKGQAAEIVEIQVGEFEKSRKCRVK